jgi:uncharacterized membrane protein
LFAGEEAEVAKFQWLFRFKVQNLRGAGIFVIGPVPILVAAARAAWCRSRLLLCQGRPWPTSPSMSIYPKASP